MEKNYYEILDVSRNTNSAEIKKKYRQLVKIHHPDKPNGDKFLFAQISVAFETLYNDEKREEYDLKLSYEERLKAEQQQKQKQKQQKQKQKQQQQQQQHDKIKYNNHTINIKKNIFPEKKEKNTYISIPITVKESMNGCIKKIKIDRVIVCSVCNGNGYGIYEKEKVSCPKCIGTGQLLENKTIKVKILPNILPSETLILKNIGNESVRSDVSNGDLILIIKWKGSWRSKNNDIYTDIDLSSKQISQGFFIFKNFNGEKIKIYIPKNIRNGQTMKINKKGWKFFDSDLYIKINIGRSFIDKIKGKFFN